MTCKSFQKMDRASLQHEDVLDSPEKQQVCGGTEQCGHIMSMCQHAHHSVTVLDKGTTWNHTSYTSGSYLCRVGLCSHQFKVQASLCCLLGDASSSKYIYNIVIYIYNIVIYIYNIVIYIYNIVIYII